MKTSSQPLPKSPQGFYRSPDLTLVPLDARPVCYTLPLQLANMAGLGLKCPPPEILGRLKQPADEAALFLWFERTLNKNARLKKISPEQLPSPVIAAMDTVAYGGLIPSRVGLETPEALKRRVNRFLSLLQQKTLLLAFSSILRIPAYDNNEEEPDYWADYGKALYDYSYAAHQTPDTAKALEKTFPESVLADFLTRRQRNYNLNQFYSGLLSQNKLDYLVFCQDDTGAYGLNVQEAQALKTVIDEKNLLNNAHVQTGADEVALCLMARCLSQWYVAAGFPALKVWIEYTDLAAAQTIAKFDGLAIETVVKRAIATCGALLAEKAQDADVTLWVHTPPAGQAQGDHCDASPPALQTQLQVDKLLSAFEAAFKKSHPVAVADVAYANGADPLLVGALLDETEPDETQRLPNLSESLYGYAGWNTPGNTIGTVVATMIVRLLAERNGTFDLTAFKKLLMVRFSDDGFYQAYARREIRREYSPVEFPMGTLPEKATALLNTLMQERTACLQKRLGLPVTDVRFCFPCDRTFEVALAPQAGQPVLTESAYL
ncbi:MAG: DUF4127 family protein [Vampirovibrionales bacterium]|nr:DUF4127 family protein [Vampirovibrionales bacterium]